MKNFSQLRKSLKNDFSGLQKIRIALLGDTSTQFLLQALQGTAFDRGFNLQILETGFNDIETQVFNEESDMYKFNPEIVVIFKCSHKLLQQYNRLDSSQHSQLADDELMLIGRLYSQINNNLKAKIIYFNYAEIDDAVFGNYANKVESSFLFQLRKLNYKLMNYAVTKTDLYLLDISNLQNQLGKSSLFHPSTYINAEMVLSIDILPAISSRMLDIIEAIYGKVKKCVILDLDNPLWGGIIGDDRFENIQPVSIRKLVVQQHQIELVFR